MSLDDYLSDINVYSYSCDLDTILKSYITSNNIRVINTYDYYDYVFNIIKYKKKINHLFEKEVANPELFFKFAIDHNFLFRFNKRIMSIAKELKIKIQVNIDTNLLYQIIKDDFK